MAVRALPFIALCAAYAAAHASGLIWDAASVCISAALKASPVFLLAISCSPNGEDTVGGCVRDVLQLVCGLCGTRSGGLLHWLHRTCATFACSASTDHVDLCVGSVDCEKLSLVSIDQHKKHELVAFLQLRSCVHFRGAAQGRRAVAIVCGLLCHCCCTRTACSICSLNTLELRILFGSRSGHAATSAATNIDFDEMMIMILLCTQKASRQRGPCMHTSAQPPCQHPRSHALHTPHAHACARMRTHSSSRTGCG
jgi:hypothetical protein